MVVELDVRDDRKSRSKLEHGAVGLVALDHEPAGAGPGIAPELRDDTSDDPRGVVPGLTQSVGDHRRSRRLTVRARDDDRRSQGNELREERCARRAGDAVPMRCRDHDLEALGWPRLAPEIHLDLAQGLREDRLSERPTRARRRPRPGRCSRRRTSPSRRSRRSRGGALRGACGDSPQAHPPPCASAISSSAITSAASGRARESIASRMAPSRAGSPSSSSTSAGTLSICAS